MRRRVYDTLLNYVRCELPIKPHTWPPIDEIEKMIVESPHYRALIDVGLPADHERKRPEDEARWLAQDTAKRLEQRWIDRKIHDCLGMKELEACMQKEIGSLKEGYSDALTFMENYYKRLEESIRNTLLFSKPIFERETLEIMIPHVASPFFHRDELINSYIQKIKN